MLAARLRKNQARLAPLFRRSDTSAYRVYDRDIPEKPWSIDLYGDRVLVTEWVTPVGRRQSEQARESERREVVRAVTEVWGVEESRQHFRTRQRHRSVEREAAGRAENEFEVKEHGLRLLVNLEDYLDTGLFLDHRPARVRIGKASKGKRVLNLFAYTGAFSVHAAAGGATRTVSVDLSRTYTAWAERNLALNGFRGPEHRVVRADTFDFLKNCSEQFDIVVLDPPTVSRAAGGRSFEIQRVQRELLEAARGVVAPGGMLFFSTNDRQFTLDPAALGGWPALEVTKETTPPDIRDFGHRAWELRKSG